MTPFQRWDAQRAQDWQAQNGWIFGCNYLPSTAVNSTEMWQSLTFDAPTIERELGWAQQLGFNSLRVFLPFIVWQHEREIFRANFKRFIEIADRHNLSVMPIFFDDCAFGNQAPQFGAQDEPVPGVHNSRWTPSPGFKVADDEAQWPRLRAYVHDFLNQFGSDERVIAWDLYNEPGNSERGDRSLPLLRAAFEWAREVEIRPPLTCGLWAADDAMPGCNAVMREQADVISFHHYAAAQSTRAQIMELQALGRPLLCTEWMSRPLHSTYQEILPLWHATGIGCYQWGLVRGRTQTNFPWGSPAGADEPELWFHDTLYEDGAPYDENEIALIRRYVTGK